MFHQVSNIAYNIKEVPGKPVNIDEINKTYNMAGISFNQMYKLSGAAETGLSYKDWISGEEGLYNSKIESGKIKGQMPFNKWLEMRWQGKMNATGDGEKKLSGILEGLKGIGKSVLDKTILNKTSGTSSSGATEDTSAPYIAPEKRILGMKPIVFWSVTGVVILTAGFVTVKAIQKMKK